MKTIEITDYLGDAAVVRDIRATVKYALDTRGIKARLVLVPYAALKTAIAKISALNQSQPWVPTVLGLPVRFSPHQEVRVACVADDGSHFEKNIHGDQEVIH